jgi:hypothetical protein
MVYQPSSCQKALSKNTRGQKEAVSDDPVPFFFSAARVTTGRFKVIALELLSG